MENLENEIKKLENWKKKDKKLEKTSNLEILLRHLVLLQKSL